MKLLLAFLLVACLSAATTPAPTNLELAKDWRVLSAMAVMISIILIALAYMTGHAFGMEDLKVWARSEMIQVFVTVLVIICFVGMTAFLDGMLQAIVNNSNLGFTCGTNCAVTVADNYLNGLIDLAVERAQSDIQASADASSKAYRRYGASTPMVLTPVPALQAATSFTTQAGEIMNVDRYNLVLEYLGNLLSSMYAQLYFVDEISFKLAPIILAIGIVARSFFPTRKLGGLMIAVGVAVMYVFPLMYVFNWLTLNITLFGASSITPSTAPCPAVCTLSPPHIYLGGSSQVFYNSTDLLEYLSSRSVSLTQTVNDSAAALDSGTKLSATFSGLSGTFYSCTNDTACPTECRDLPYPQVPSCQNSSAEATCTYESASSLTCIATGTNYKMTGCTGTGVSLTCGIAKCTRKGTSATCTKTGLNLTACTYNDAGTITCTTDTGTYRKSGCTRTINSLSCDSGTTSCTLEIAATCNIPIPVACSALNGNCKMVRYAAPVSTYDSACPTDCRSVPPLKSNCSLTGADPYSCYNGKDFCKFTRRNDLNAKPDGCSSDPGATTCPGSLTATQSCKWVLPSQTRVDSYGCDGCNFVPQPYTYDPPIYLSCADLCSPSPTGPPKISPAEFAKRSAEGMQGKQEIKDVAVLMLPAYVLPILNVLVTVIFVRTLSPILGGDIEIPGIARIL